MARLVGPDEGSRLVYTLRGDNSLGTAAGLPVVVYADEAATTLADILTEAGDPIAGSELTVGAASLLPLFQFPDGANVVWVTVNGGPLSPVYARGGGGAVDSVNGQAGVVVLDAADVGAVAVEAVGAADGVASLDSDGKVPAGQLPDAVPQPGVFNVRDYGAIGDGVADDTAAIRSAVDAAYSAGVADGTHYAEVYFPPGRYLLSSPTVASATNKGNAQIPLPVVPTTSPKFTLAFRGTAGITALPHWQQTSPQRGGATLVSTLTGQTVNATYGPPSVIGGPSTQQGYGETTGLFSNMLVVVDGVGVSVPNNPTIMGFNFSCVAEMIVHSANVNASVAPGVSEPTRCTNSWAVGLYTPQRRNNDKCPIYDYSCEGMAVGVILSEHAALVNGQIIYCDVGIDILTSMDWVTIGYVSVERCRIMLQAEQLGSGLAKVNCDILDVEIANSGNFALGQVVNDPNDLLRGEINVHVLAATGTSDIDPAVNGANGARIIRADRQPGAVAAPSLPASGTALRNPFWRDAAVTVTGGTVTGISVDGAATGLTSGTVIVPTGQPITVIYSGTPTWVWTLL